MQHFSTGSFPFSPISNCIKTTAQYILLYISSARMVDNSHNGSKALQKLTVADLQYILRTTGSIMYLKQAKCPRFWCNGNVFVKWSVVQRMVQLWCALTVVVQRMVQWRCAVTVGVQRMVQWRCAVTVGVQELRQQNCRLRSGPSYLPAVWFWSYINICYFTLPRQTHYENTPFLHEYRRRRFV